MQVALTWNVVTNAVSYNVYRSTTSGSGYQPIAYTVTQPNYTDGPGGLTNGQLYYYTVTAVTADGESMFPVQVTATPVAFPAAPTGLAAVVT